MKYPICEMELHKVEGKFPGWVCDKCEMLWKVELLCQDDAFIAHKEGMNDKNQ